MDKKKILIVCHGFYPENSPRANRASELVKEFALQGHSVVVLTPKRPEHIAFEKEHQVQIKDLGKPKWKVPNFGSSKPGYLLTRMGVRFMQLFMEYPAIELMFKVKKALRMESGYDMLISIAVPYPIHWGVAKVWEKQQSIAKTWVADCGDPYMGCETDSFQKFFYFKYIEKWFMRKADYISIPVESARSGYYDEFQGKIKIIPQGFKFDLIEGSDKPVRNDIPTFAYAGGFIPNIRDPRPFLDYLVTLDHNFKFSGLDRIGSPERINEVHFHCVINPAGLDNPSFLVLQRQIITLHILQNGLPALVIVSFKDLRRDFKFLCDLLILLV